MMKLKNKIRKVKMETVEAIYENGKVKFLTRNLPKRRFKVLVTFLEELELPPQKEMTWKEFLQKWEGIIEGADIENYKDERAQYLKEKYR